MTESAVRSRVWPDERGIERCAIIRLARRRCRLRRCNQTTMAIDEPCGLTRVCEKGWLAPGGSASRACATWPATPRAGRNSFPICGGNGWSCCPRFMACSGLPAQQERGHDARRPPNRRGCPRSIRLPASTEDVGERAGRRYLCSRAIRLVPLVVWLMLLRIRPSRGGTST